MCNLLDMERCLSVHRRSSSDPEQLQRRNPPRRSRFPAGTRRAVRDREEQTADDHVPGVAGRADQLHVRRAVGPPEPAHDRRARRRRDAGERARDEHRGNEGGGGGRPGSGPVLVRMPRLEQPSGQPAEIRQEPTRIDTGRV